MSSHILSFAGLAAKISFRHVLPCRTGGGGDRASQALCGWRGDQRHEAARVHRARGRSRGWLGGLGAGAGDARHRLSRLRNPGALREPAPGARARLAAGHWGIDVPHAAGQDARRLGARRLHRNRAHYGERRAARDEQRAAAAEEAARLRAKSDEEVRQAQELARVDLQDHADVQYHQAMKTEAKAIKLENATTAELSTVRGTQAVSGLRTRWVAEITDKQKLDLEKLRPYLRLEHLQTALNGYMAAGGREITGAVIEERSTISVR